MNFYGGFRCRGLSFVSQQKKQKCVVTNSKLKNHLGFRSEPLTVRRLLIAATQLYAVLPLKPSLFFTFVI
jgi:hypothetical protein